MKNQAELKKNQIQTFACIIGLMGILYITGFTKENGIAYFAAAFECFLFVWILSGMNIPDAVTGLFRGKTQKGQYKNIKKLKSRIMGIQFIIGILSMVIFAFGGAYFVAGVLKMPHAVPLVFLMAPALFFRNITSGILGFFQGEGSYMPTGACAVLRVIFTLGFGVLFGLLLKSYGTKVSMLLLNNDFEGMYAAMGIAAAFTLAEFFVLIFTLLVYKASPSKNANYDGGRAVESFFGLLLILYSNMGPKILINLFCLLPFIAGAVLFGRSFDDTALYVNGYGEYIGRYIAFTSICVLLLDIGFGPMVNRTCAHYYRKEVKPAKICFQGGLHHCVVWGLFLSVALMTLAEQTAGIISADNAGRPALFFGNGSFIIILVSLSIWFLKLLYAADKKPMAIVCLGITDIVFVTACAFFLKNSSDGAASLVYSGIVSAAILCACSAFCTVRGFGINISLVQCLGIPIGCVCIGGLACLFIGNSITPHLGNLIGALVSLAIALLVYIVLLLLLKNFRESELKFIPGGKYIRLFGKMLKLL